jgi:O-antigen/teichoic acid export membrane protein
VKTFSAYVSELRRMPRPHAAFGVSLVAYKASADVASKMVTLVVTVAAARTLTADDFGVMALAMTTGWLLGVASDAVLPMFAATSIANADAAGEGTRAVAREVVRWRVRLALIAAAIAAGLAGVLVPEGAALAFGLIVLHQLFGAMLDTVAHVFRGLGRTDIESTIALAHRGAIAFGALTVLSVSPSLIALAFALVVPPALAFGSAIWVIRRVTREGSAYSLSARTFARSVIPLGAGVLLSALYFRIDVFFLERFHGIEIVGLYNAAFRIVDALRLFPGAALAVAYPLLCAATDVRPLLRLTGVVAASSLVVAGGVFLAAPPLLTLIYGNSFAIAAPPLRVLALAIPLFFINYALTHQLIAWGQQRAYVTTAVAALTVNISLDLLWIPRWQMTGAAAATVVTEVVVCAGCLIALRWR